MTGRALLFSGVAAFAAVLCVMSMIESRIVGGDRAWGVVWHYKGSLTEKFDSYGLITLVWLTGICTPLGYLIGNTVHTRQEMRNALIGALIGSALAASIFGILALRDHPSRRSSGLHLAEAMTLIGLLGGAALSHRANR